MILVATVEPNKDLYCQHTIQYKMNSQDVLLQIFEKVDLKTKINMMIAIGKDSATTRKDMQTIIKDHLSEILTSLNEWIVIRTTDCNKPQYHFKHAGTYSDSARYYILSEDEANEFDGISEGGPEGVTTETIKENTMTTVLADVKQLAVRMLTSLITTPSDQPSQLIQVQAEKLTRLITAITFIQNALGHHTGGKKKNLNNLTVK